MAKFLITLLTITLCYISPLSAYENGGKIILELEDEKEISSRDFQGLYEEYLQELDLFDKKYPNSTINENFSQDIEELHPEYTNSEVNFKHKLIRFGVLGKRWYNYLKNKLQQTLLENDIPLIFEDNQYEMGDKEKYQESDKPLIIVNLKKAIAYSNLPQDQEAIKDKISRDAGILTPYERKQIMKKAFLNKDWKTLLSYGLFDGNIFEDKRGIGKWNGYKNIAARIVVQQKSIANQKYINGVLDIYINPKYFLLRYPFKQYSGSNLDFSRSTNLKNITYHWPLPQRKIVKNQESFSGYIHMVEIPFTAEIDNQEQELNLIADLSAFVCKEHNCLQEDFSTSLNIATGGKPEETLLSQKVKMARNSIPKEEHSQISIKNLYAEEINHKSYLILEVASKTAIEKPNVFIENNENINFEPLQIVQNDELIKVYFSSPLSIEELIEKKLRVLFATDKKNIVTKELNIIPRKLSETNFKGIKIKNLFLAVLGGLLLNFMPSIMVLWLIKIKSFCVFGGVTPFEVKKEFKLNIIGISSSLACIYIMLCILKLTNNQLNYLNLFESSLFLSLSIFTILLITAYIFGIVKISNQIPSNLKHIMLGILSVELALIYNLPLCTQILDIAVINNSLSQYAIAILCIGTGFMLPYVVAMLFPDFVFYLPYPERWFRDTEKLAYMLLGIALIWVMMILTSQTSGHLWWQSALFLLLAWVILLFRFYIIGHLDEQEKNPIIHAKIKRFFDWCAGILILLIFAGFYANIKYHQGKFYNNCQSCITTDISSIDHILKNGNNILLQVDANWCLRCFYNNYVVMNSERIQKIINNSNTFTIKLDIKKNLSEVQKIMHQFQQYEIPLYILYTPQMPYGYVLPKTLDESDLYNLLSANYIPQAQNL